MDGEVAITQNDNPDRPFIYRGFQMINQDKLRELRGDQLRSWNQNGMLPLVFAQIFSLDLMRNIFARQTQQGFTPQPPARATPSGWREGVPLFLIFSSLSLSHFFCRNFVPYSHFIFQCHKMRRTLDRIVNTTFLVVAVISAISLSLSGNWLLYFHFHFLSLSCSLFPLSPLFYIFPTHV